MNWFTKTVIVDKVVEVEKIILGDASRASVYEAYTTKLAFNYDSYFTAMHEKETHLGYFLSCAEAFKNHPGCKVKERTGIRIGNQYFVVRGIEPVTVNKPKRGKGKA
jgi:hypothetical protein